MLNILSIFKSNSIKNKLLFIFNILDKNKRGKITVDEYKEYFYIINIKDINNKELDDIILNTFQYADSNNDGYLDFKEFEYIFSNNLKLNI